MTGSTQPPGISEAEEAAFDAIYGASRRTREDARRLARTVVAAALPHLRAAIADEILPAAREACREWPEGASNYCYKPADVILWGKLFPPEALGPRCSDHARLYVALDAHSVEQSAVFDLRPLAAARVARGGPTE